ncbi:hypothetical protein PFISCL1PPCAC_10481 [Pristionchus fissidentatus]|uniref:Uncharacterized protein n=1 Tax=Pristionchus fissidentatus TaxID=1538716 RepID=A0AAV5VLC7_9BILA|nr:hypothetical protein PFISCL1PPCAC_10481 [Pristionchus fissidentatus]
MRDRLEVPLRSSIRKNEIRHEDRHVTFDEMSSGGANNMEKKSKTKQSKQGAERKRNTVSEKEQSKKQKKNEIVTRVQEGREEVVAAEEFMRKTERKVSEMKQNSALRFKNLGMLIRQVPQVEERKHKLRMDWSEIEKNSRVIEEAKDLANLEQAIDDYEEFVTVLVSELDSVTSKLDSLEESNGDLNEMLPLLSHLLTACNIE